MDLTLFSEQCSVNVDARASCNERNSVYDERRLLLTLFKCGIEAGVGLVNFRGSYHEFHTLRKHVWELWSP